MPLPPVRSLTSVRLTFRYVDFMNGFGANVLGYAHPEVDEAATEAQKQYGAILTGPTEVSVLLSEKLVSLRPGATWSILGKNGSDVTSTAARAARAGTGKRLILRAIDGGPSQNGPASMA